MPGPVLSAVPDVAVEVTPRIVQVLAPNADEWTYGGTNTWLVTAGPGDRCIVIDPGTGHEGHLRAVRHAATSRGWKITAVALTHSHPDHRDGARELADAVGAPVIGHADAGVDLVLDDGDTLEAYGATARVLHTPGHSHDSLCFDINGTHLVTGDTVLGGYSSAVYGDFGDYLRSLERIIQLSERHATGGLPGHGSYIPDVETAAAQVLSARRRRVEQVRESLAAHPQYSADELTASIYSSTAGFHLPSATQMVIGIAGHLLEVDHDSPADVRDAYRRLATAQVLGL